MDNTLTLITESDSSLKIYNYEAIKLQRPISKHAKTSMYRKKTLDPNINIDIAVDNDQLENIDEYWKMAESVLEDDTLSIVDSSIGQNPQEKKPSLSGKNKENEVINNKILPLDIDDGNISDSSICSIHDPESYDDNKNKCPVPESSGDIGEDQSETKKMKISDVDSTINDKLELENKDDVRKSIVLSSDESYDEISITELSKKLSDKNREDITESFVNETTAREDDCGGDSVTNSSIYNFSGSERKQSDINKDVANYNDTLFNIKDIKENLDIPMARGKVAKTRATKSKKTFPRRKQSIKQREDVSDQAEMGDLSISNIVDEGEYNQDSYESMQRDPRESIYGADDVELGMTAVSTYSGQSKLEPLVTSKSLETAILHLNVGAYIKDELAEVAFSLYIIKGRVDIHINNVSYTYKRDSCVVIERKSKYSIYNDGKTVCSIFITYNV